MSGNLATWVSHLLLHFTCSAPLNDQLCAITGLSCRVTKCSLTVSTAWLHSVNLTALATYLVHEPTTMVSIIPFFTYLLFFYTVNLSKLTEGPYKSLEDKVGLPFKGLIINTSVVRFLGFAINLQFGLFQFFWKAWENFQFWILEFFSKNWWLSLKNRQRTSSLLG